MRRFALWMIVSLAGLVHADAARGHFLFIRIGAHAEAGRTVEVFFSERAEAGDPRFIEKVAPTKLSAQTRPGKFRSLTVRQGTDRLRAFLPALGSVSVDGELVYGVVTRKVPFLLRYFPKAIAGVPKDLNAMKPRIRSAAGYYGGLDKCGDQTHSPQRRETNAWRRLHDGRR